MNHPDEGTLQALLDDEIPRGVRPSLEGHLSTCPECRVQMEDLRDARSELSAALRLLDRPAPVELAYRRILRRRRWGASSVVLRRAAVLLIAVTTALSATVPGSPLREWVLDAWRGNAETEEQTVALETAGAPPAVEAVPELPPAGVSVRPMDQRMRVVLVRPAAGLRVVARLHEGEQVEVSATGPAAKGRFRTGPNRIELEGAEAGEVRIEIPRAVEQFALEVDGQVLLSKQGQNLRVPERASQSAGPAVLLEVQP